MKRLCRRALYSFPPCNVPAVTICNISALPSQLSGGSSQSPGSARRSGAEELSPPGLLSPARPHLAGPCCPGDRDSTRHHVPGPRGAAGLSEGWQGRDTLHIPLLAALPAGHSHTGTAAAPAQRGAAPHRQPRAGASTGLATPRAKLRLGRNITNLLRCQYVHFPPKHVNSEGATEMANQGAGEEGKLKRNDRYSGLCFITSLAIKEHNVPMNGIAQLLFEDFFFVHGLLSKRRADVSK